MDKHDFYMGKSFDAYTQLGAHYFKGGTYFCTFAPNAARVSVIGEFNNWTDYDMNRADSGGLWEITIPDADVGQMYKYRIYQRNGAIVDHCDPYGYGSELRPANASIIRDMHNFKFGDREWMMHQLGDVNKPLNIYEVAAGSFRKKGNLQTDWLNYKELAKILVPYVLEKGYNCIELMPISEYPLDNSWGYQNTGFYCPTSRFGTADDLKYFIDYCHKGGVGVIMDFVPVHFAVDYYALAKFDGTPLYEYPENDIEKSEWGSYNFNHSRGEVRSFLQSCANYWLTEYHIDGIRMDAVSRLIYWKGDISRGTNPCALEFLKIMNSGLKALHNNCILIAEDSTSYPNVTKKVSDGGLGFDYKWDMGFMNDTLEYFKKTPEERIDNYHKLTFSMMYFYSEKFLLPFSHDENVHGKATILQKMYGSEKFPQARALYMYMYAHPGKKLNFMGGEIGHFREFDENREIDWDLLKFDSHVKFAKFMEDLNNLYIETPCLWTMDYDRNGFRWIDCHEEEKCIYAFERNAAHSKLIAVFNFSDKIEEYELEINTQDYYTLTVDSQWDKYGGTKKKLREVIDGKKVDRITLSLLSYECCFYIASDIGIAENDIMPASHKELKDERNAKQASLPKRVNEKKYTDNCHKAISNKGSKIRM